MKSIKNSIILMTIATVLLTSAGVCAEENALDASLQDKDASNLVQKATIIPVDRKDRPWYQDRLEIGLRLSFNKMDTENKWNEGSHEGFLGTIAHFENKDKVQFSNVILSYRVLDWLSLGATWDMIDEVAVTRTSDMHCDGEWKDSGPSLSFVFTSPKKFFGMITPYAELGTHLANGTFEAYPWWHLGYPSPNAYREAGSPSKGRGSYRRYISSEESDSLTLLWGAGVKIQITDHFLLDFAYRHIDCDQTAHFYLERGGMVTKDNGLYDIPLSYAQFCAGVRYVF